MRTPLLVGLLACALTGVAAGQGGDPALNPGANRAQLEMQLRQKFARRARVVLGLNPDQMARLADVDRRFGQQQRSVDQQENQTRRALRSALLEAPSADQDRRVGQLHEQLMQLQRQRLDIVSAEQKELSGFLTNVQRVRFQGLQENFRRQVQQALAANANNELAPGGGRQGRPPR